MSKKSSTAKKRNINKGNIHIDKKINPHGNSTIDNNKDGVGSIENGEPNASTYTTLDDMPVNEPLKFRIRMEDDKRQGTGSWLNDEDEPTVFPEDDLNAYTALFGDKRSMTAEQVAAMQRNKHKFKNTNVIKKVQRASTSQVKEAGILVANSPAYRAMTPRMRRHAYLLGLEPQEMTVLETVMLNLATSNNPVKIALFLERTYGKVPNINLNAQISENLVARFKDKLTDSELEAIAAGADVFEILMDKLPNADGDDDDIVDSVLFDTDEANEDKDNGDT